HHRRGFGSANNDPSLAQGREKRLARRNRLCGVDESARSHAGGKNDRVETMIENALNQLEFILLRRRAVFGHFAGRGRHQGYPAGLGYELRDFFGAAALEREHATAVESGHGSSIAKSSSALQPRPSPTLWVASSGRSIGVRTPHRSTMKSLQGSPGRPFL